MHSHCVVDQVESDHTLGLNGVVLSMFDVKSPNKASYITAKGGS